MNPYLTVGLATLAGAVLLEVALVPAVAVAGAVVIAPRVVSGLRRQIQPAIDAVVRPPAVPPAPWAEAATSEVAQEEASEASLLARLGLKQAIAKTITFRIIVTSLDFTTNYVVLGELSTAAGLSTFSLVAGPIFYFAHETVWNHLRPSQDQIDVTMPAMPQADGADLPSTRGGWRISRALAKTITFRTIATVMDFTTNFVVVGDVVTAAGLSVTGFVLGPFVYWGHEKVWDRFTQSQELTIDQPRPVNVPIAIGESRRALA